MKRKAYEIHARFVQSFQPIVPGRQYVVERASGYTNFFGMAGRHQTFHTPADDLGATGPEILEPVARAFVDAVRKIVERGGAAFK